MKLLRFYNSTVNNSEGQWQAETEVSVINPANKETIMLCVSSKINHGYQSSNITIDEQERDELVEFLQQLKFV